MKTKTGGLLFGLAVSALVTFATAAQAQQATDSWGGAAGTGFWATPSLGLSVTLMTQLMPAGAVPARDMLRPLVYAAL